MPPPCRCSDEGGSSLRTGQLRPGPAPRLLRPSIQPGKGGLGQTDRAGAECSDLDWEDLDWEDLGGSN